MTMPHQHIILTKLQQDALTGSMLGDGHIYINKLNAAYAVSRCVKDKEYLEYEANLFKTLLAPRYQNGLMYADGYDKRSGNYYPTYTFGTINNSCFTEFYNEWYPNGKKIIPKNLELSAVTVAHWIADDGHVSIPKSPHRFSLEISTNCFSKEDVEFLISLLENRYKEKFNLSPKTNETGTCYIIRAYDSACRAVFKDIDPVFKMQRKRIWENPETRFYTNQPRKTKSVVESYAWRTQLMKEIFEKHDHISLQELGQYMKYVGFHCPTRFVTILEPYAGKYEIQKINNKNILIFHK